MNGNDIKLIRDQARMAVDPQIMKLRMELYGSGITYGKFLSTSLVPQDSQGGIEQNGFIKGITTLSGGVEIGTTQKELNFVGAGVYSVDGRTTIVISSGQFSAGNYYTKTEADVLLGGKSNTGHTHVASNITDFASAVAATPAVSANTAKVTNQYHTGDVTGDTYLTISDDAVTLAKLADSGASPGMSFVYSGGGWHVGYPSTSGSVGLHNYTHFTGGIDPIAPSDIGAATASGLSQEITDRTAADTAHSQVIASSGQLGHIRVGANLSITSSGVLSAIAASGLQDPTTSPGDLITRDASNTVTRLPIGASGYMLFSTGTITQWRAAPSTLDVITDQAQTFSDIDVFKVLNSVVTSVSGVPNIRPGLTIKQLPSTTLGDRVHTLIFGSGISGSVTNTNEITIVTSVGIDLATHAATVASSSVLGHVKIGSGINIDGSNQINWDGLTIKDNQGTTLTQIKTLQLYRGRVQASGSDAVRMIPAIRAENVIGTVLESMEILYFGDGITATTSGTGRVVITAGSASDFIIQTVTSGVTDKAPSSKAVYDMFYGHTHDDRYYVKSGVDGLLAGKSNVGHHHIAADIDDFDEEVRNNPYVLANTAKVTNATHTGEVTGSGYLIISSGVITPNKLSSIGANEGNTIVFASGAWHYQSLSAVAISSGVIDGGSFTAPGASIRIMRGDTADLPLALNNGEFGWDTTANSLWIGSPTGNKLVQDAQRIQGRNVVISSPANNHALIWNSTTSRFENMIPPKAVDSDSLGGVAAASYLQTSHASQIASSSVLGHIKVGGGLAIDGTGILSVPFAVWEDGGNVKTNPTVIDFRHDFNVTTSGTGVRVILDDTIHPSGPATYTTLGHVIVGANLTVDVNGVISAIASSGLVSPMTSTGDLIYQSALGPTRLPIGSTGQILVVSGGIPAWNTVTFSGGGSGGGPITGSGESIGGMLYLWSNYY